MRICICDDDHIVFEQLNKLLLKYFKDNKYPLPDIVYHNCGDSLLSDNKSFDIIFLDIEMPGISGVCVGNKISKANPECIIIVITSYSEYLDDAMRFNVFRYLSKPLDKHRLFRNLNDAIARYNSISQAISFKCHNKHLTVNINDIIMVESLKRELIVHTTNGDFLTTDNITYWNSVLPQNSFYACYRSTIINLKYVTEYDKSVIKLFNNQFVAYISKRKYSDFKSHYLMYLGNNAY